jgi:hypothetical protein
MSVSTFTKLPQQVASLAANTAPVTVLFKGELAQAVQNPTTLVKPVPAIDPKIIQSLNRAYYRTAPPPDLAPLPATAKFTPPACLKPTGIFALIAGAEFFLTSGLEVNLEKFLGEIPWHFSQTDLLDTRDQFKTMGWNTGKSLANLKALKPAQKHKLLEASLALTRDKILDAASLKIALTELLKRVEQGDAIKKADTPKTGKLDLTALTTFKPSKQPLDPIGAPTRTKRGIVPSKTKQKPLKRVPDVASLPIVSPYKTVPTVPKIPSVKPAQKGGGIVAPKIKNLELEPLVKKNGSRPPEKKFKKQDVIKKQAVSNSASDEPQTGLKKGTTDNPSKAQMQRKTKQQIDRASNKITELFDTIDGIASRYEKIIEKFNQLTAKIDDTKFINDDINGRIKFNQAVEHSKIAEQLLSDVEKAMTSIRENFSKTLKSLAEITQYKENTDEILVEVRENISTMTTELKTANAKVIRANQRINWAMETLSKEASRQNRR